jgi:hypothetical protein
MTDSEKVGRKFVDVFLKLLDAHGEAYPGAQDDAKELRAMLDEDDAPVDPPTLTTTDAPGDPNDRPVV